MPFNYILFWDLISSQCGTWISPNRLHRFDDSVAVFVRLLWLQHRYVAALTCGFFTLWFQSISVSPTPISYDFNLYRYCLLLWLFCLDHIMHIRNDILNLMLYCVCVCVSVCVVCMNIIWLWFASSQYKNIICCLYNYFCIFFLFKCLCLYHDFINIFRELISFL